jgi:HTH-type transcriptional regulator / antitoxin HigA
MGYLKKEWFLLNSDEDLQQAEERYQEIKYASPGTEEHKEKILLVHLISKYEEEHDDLPEVDPIELIKIRMDDFGFKPKDLAALYGDKGTVSKVLAYKQSLSLTMIRKFSEALRIPIAALVADYPLRVHKNV